MKHLFLILVLVFILHGCTSTTTTTGIGVGTGVFYDPLYPYWGWGYPVWGNPHWDRFYYPTYVVPVRPASPYIPPSRYQNRPIQRGTSSYPGRNTIAPQPQRGNQTPVRRGIVPSQSPTRSRNNNQ